MQIKKLLGLVRTAWFIAAWPLSVDSYADEVPPPPPPSEQPKVTARPKIGLVLSGGGARGAAHIGVLKVLEEMHIPVDYIAGTSMGAIVGAAYASGATTAEMENDLKELTVGQLFNDAPPRQDQTMRRKTDDLLPYIGPEFGVNQDGLSLPKGAIVGVSLEAVLRKLAKIKGERDFNRLPIPYRAIATDIETGEMVVFDHGDLPTVMRASMAVPGLVAPAEIDGRILADGGLTRNLPVDVVRQMGADVVIAVNLGTPLLKRDRINSLLGVSAQVINILTEQNVRRSLSELKSNDVLISPELDDYSAGNFDAMVTTVPLGEAAARIVADTLHRYALSPRAYAELRQKQALPKPGVEGVIDVVRVEGTQRVNPEVLIEAMDTQPGKPINQLTLDRDLRRLYGQGDIESIGYHLATNDQQQRELVVDVTEKSWGPDYLRFGLGLRSDLRSVSIFDLYATYRRTWLNRFGAEWRTDAQIGGENKLLTEFYQPLTARQYFFVAPYLQATRSPLDIYVDDLRIGQFTEVSTGGGIDLGANFSKYGEARFGLVALNKSLTLDSGPQELRATKSQADVNAWRARLRVDQLDSSRFPRNGYRGTADLIASRTPLGASDRYTRWESEWLSAASLGNNTLQLGLRGGGTLGDNALPDYDVFKLGGFLNLSGYRPNQFLARDIRFGRLVYQRKLIDAPLLEGAYFGLSAEAAHIKPLLANTPTYLRSLGAFIGTDTPIGPLYFGVGFADRGNRAVYLFLGRP